MIPKKQPSQTNKMKYFRKISEKVRTKYGIGNPPNIGINEALVNNPELIKIEEGTEYVGRSFKW